MVDIDAADEPIAFVATAVKVYEVPTVRPVITQLVGAAVVKVAEVVQLVAVEVQLADLAW